MFRLLYVCNVITVESGLLFIFILLLLTDIDMIGNLSIFLLCNAFRIYSTDGICAANN